MRKLVLICLVITMLFVVVGCNKQVVSEEVIDTPELQDEGQAVEVEDDKIVIDVATEDIFEVLTKTAEDYGLKDFEYVTGYVDLPKYVLVFSSKYCEACKYFAPTAFQYINMADTSPLFYVSLDDETNHEFARELEIEVTPTIIFIENGEEVDRIERIAEIDELLEKSK